MGTGGVASLCLAFSIFMIVAYCRRIRRYRDFRHVFNHDETEPLLPPSSQPSTSSSNTKRWTSEKSATPSSTPSAMPSATPSATPFATPASEPVKTKPTSTKSPKTPSTEKSKPNEKPTHSQPTNQNVTNISPTNPLPSCSTSTYQAPLPAKKEKKSWLSNLFSKKTNVDESRPADVDVTVNIVKESKNTKQKAKKSKKVTVPIDNTAEHRVILEDCPNCPEESEDKEKLIRPPNKNNPG